MANTENDQDNSDRETNCTHCHIQEELKQLKLIQSATLTAINNLTVQLSSLEVGKDNTNSSLMLVPTSTNATANTNQAPTRTHGYVNWNSSHDILKTKHWKQLEEFLEFCGKCEKGLCKNSFIYYIKMKKFNSVDENNRFPKNVEYSDNQEELFINVNNPQVAAEILYIKAIHNPNHPNAISYTGLVERFLRAAKIEMHNVSSFEQKYGLKWVDPKTDQKH